jgi:hypothetical protein
MPVRMGPAVEHEQTEQHGGDDDHPGHAGTVAQRDAE